ncbi:hypothetical protein DPMN_033789 [Dreissena polymorpha]|uniref:Uncharacterized protein n=1 Tax=Dreissena polymorpha TaxID=45954 RepID=A0A9D4RJ53_DREPO|nr:hypothetical protein DPMN_033789 [Dreissena polymorpha]
MTLRPRASHPMNDLCANLEITRAIHRVYAAFFCSRPENSSNSPDVSRFCPDPVHLYSLIYRMEVELPHSCDHFRCVPCFVKGLKIPCIDGGVDPGGDDDLRRDGFQLTDVIHLTAGGPVSAAAFPRFIY